TPLHLEQRRMEICLEPRPYGCESIIGVADGHQSHRHVFALISALADIITAGVAQDIGQSVFTPDSFGFAPDDCNQFGFIMHNLTHTRVDNVTTVTPQTSVRLHENRWDLGNFATGFMNMGSIVETHTDNPGVFH